MHSETIQEGVFQKIVFLARNEWAEISPNSVQGTQGSSDYKWSPHNVSIEVEIIPTSLSLVKSRCLQNALHFSSKNLFASPMTCRLLKLKTKQFTADDEALEVQRSYNLVFNHNVGPLGLYISSNAEVFYDDELTELEEFATNVSRSERERIAEAWRSANYTIDVMSYPPRTPQTKEVFFLLATCVATLHSGYILVSEYAFGLPGGIYTPEEFKGRASRLLS